MIQKICRGIDTICSNTFTWKADLSLKSMKSNDRKKTCSIYQTVISYCLLRSSVSTMWGGVLIASGHVILLPERVYSFYQIYCFSHLGNVLTPINGSTSRQKTPSLIPRVSTHPSPVLGISWYKTRVNLTRLTCIWSSSNPTNASKIHVQLWWFAFLFTEW